MVLLLLSLSALLSRGGGSNPSRAPRATSQFSVASIHAALTLRGGGKGRDKRKAVRFKDEGRGAGKGDKGAGRRLSFKGGGVEKLGGAAQGVRKEKRLQKPKKRLLAGVAVPLPSHHRSRDAAPPLVVAIVPITKSADAHAAAEALVGMCTARGGTLGSDTRTMTLLLPAPWGGGQGRRVTLLAVRHGDAEATLDACKVADHAVLLFAGEEMPPAAGEVESGAFGAHGGNVLALLRANGVPSVYAAAQGLGGVGQTKRDHLRRERGRVLEAESIGEQHELRPVDLGMEQQVSALLRSICGRMPKGSPWRVPYR